MDGEQQTLIAVESMTKKTIGVINEKKQLLKVKREMYENRFENDDGWKKSDKEYREARLRRAQEKLRILESAEMQSLDEEIRTISGDIKTEQLALSDWLYNYDKQTGSNMVELDNGATYIVQRNFKVKKEGKAARWLRLHKPDVLAKYPGYQTSMGMSA